MCFLCGDDSDDVCILFYRASPNLAPSLSWITASTSATCTTSSTAPASWDPRALSTRPATTFVLSTPKGIAINTESLGYVLDNKHIGARDEVHFKVAILESSYISDFEMDASL